MQPPQRHEGRVTQPAVVAGVEEGHHAAQGGLWGVGKKVRGEDGPRVGRVGSCSM